MKNNNTWRRAELDIKRMEISAKIDVLARILAEAKKYSLDLVFCAEAELKGQKALLSFTNNLEEGND